jgi:hypothetical protein
MTKNWTNSHVGHILQATLEYIFDHQLHAISELLAQESDNYITRDIFETMQAEEGKAGRKSNKITKTSTRNPSVAVTPSMKVSKREQVEAKKVKQIRKKELEAYFGKGSRVQAPSREGTPINAVLQRREKGRPDHGEGKERPTNLALLKGAMKATVQTPQQMKDNGKEGQGGGNTKTKTSKKKSPSKGLDNETSRKSKRTKLDNKVSVLGGKGLDSLVANLEAMKGLLRKKGAGKVKPMDVE